ncbi:DUF1707 SHOCT-like domain-containing protein [Nonomuraea rhodomycinica]|uniref:DUF1707 domain-containing protein n=1 Tax=Nonomuraea rhodomycinica TaxID=1712872 RepID=A0A7Y6MDJ3_9ACTN|nr:DUF1707 domain-containing protein [Nonomuraea rhodomycinica]NUW42781.1 DUF1707 domain-containing protein [Nonomuraea rhodomycinica]
MTGFATDSRLGEREAPAMDPKDLRIGDAERERTMEALREHFAQGRLDHQELDERLDRTLAAKTARDLAEITADLPGSPAVHPGPGMPGASGMPGMDDWKAAMHAHRQQMEQVHDTHRKAHRAYRDLRRGGRRHHGPPPFVPILGVFLILGAIFGGWGVLKVLFVLWIVGMVFGLIHRKSNRR